MLATLNNKAQTIATMKGDIEIAFPNGFSFCSRASMLRMVIIVLGSGFKL
jgi:hypothetical protein